jgi:hypothetical protein
MRIPMLEKYFNKIRERAKVIISHASESGLIGLTFYKDQEYVNIFNMWAPNIVDVL